MSLPKPPAELEFIDTFLQRGRELREREPIVAYYCNYYAAKLAMERGFKSKESEAFLSSLVDLLQEDKKNLASSEAISNDVVAYAHIENFALKIFVNADNEDRAGKASKRTAKTFLAASIFLELLKQFGELDGEIKQKIKYAKFKAADIVKALKEGRIPTAGPPGGDPNDLEGLGGASDLPAADTQDDYGDLPFDEEAHRIMTQAQKHAKFAISALQYEDIKTAVDNLQKALAVLGPLAARK
nr:hypothetical protein HK105_004192 [Polyrhizophydium stewartii]